MNKIRIILVDDNEDSLDIMKFYVEQLPEFLIVDCCKNGNELIDSVLRTNPDVILLDINMPRLNGIEAIRACLKIRSELLFIFITSYDEYAVEAFELSAVDYVVKPIEKTRLYTALEKVKKARRSPPLRQRLIIKDGQDYYYIPFSEINFIEKIGKKCYIYTSDKHYITNDNIGDLLSQLPDQTFFLSHRSYIVNISKISRVLSRNQTYLAYFINSDKYAHVSKLKIDDLLGKIV